jgi:hypothetical protein
VTQPRPQPQPQGNGQGKGKPVQPCNTGAQNGKGKNSGAC